MNTIDILQNLKPYVEFLEELRQQEGLSKLQEEKGFKRLEKSVSCEYSFITLELKAIIQRIDSTGRDVDQRLICKIYFEIVQDRIVLKEVYHENPVRKTTLEHIVSANKKISGVKWQTEARDRIFCKEYLNYLTVADEIASPGIHCASGDNYRPGFYSEIRISDDGIELNQINRMNSKSLDHKENYSMRDLEIFIPFGKSPEKMRFNEYTIGEMKISFSDRSSPNLRSCGEAIIARIKAAKEQWQK